MFERRTVQTVYGDVEAFVAGPSSPSLLYLHGEAAVAPDPAATALAQAHGVAAPIHPGFEKAPRPGWVETIRDVADLYVEAVPQLVPDGPVVVVGVSLGGWIAAELALLRPELVSRLVLIGPAGLFAPEAPPADHWFATDDERASILFRDVSNAPVLEASEFIANDETTARYAWNPRFGDPSLNERIRRLRMPVSLVWGADDRLFPVGLSEMWLEALPDARLVTVPESGHFPSYEAPQAVVDAVLDGAGDRAPTSATTKGAS